MSFNESPNLSSFANTVSSNAGAPSGVIPTTFDGRAVDQYFDTDGNWSASIQLPVPAFSGQILWIRHDATFNSTVATTNTTMSGTVTLTSSLRGIAFLAIGNRWYRITNP